MKTRYLTQPFIAITLGLLTSHAIAKPGNGKGNGKGNSGASHAGDKGKAHKAHKHQERKAHKGHKNHSADKFDDKERNALEAIFRVQDGTRQLPPGLAKNLKRGKPLPPGWQKKLVPGYRIENDIWNSLTPISHDWVPGTRRIPNTQLYYRENRVIRVLDATREILDVITLK